MVAFEKEREELYRKNYTGSFCCICKVLLLSVWFFKKHLLIYLWLCWVFVAAWGLSLAAVTRGFSHGVPPSPSWWRLLLLQSMNSRVWAQWSWHMGLAALRHVESSQIGDWTCVSRVLNRCTIREVHICIFFNTWNKSTVIRIQNARLSLFRLL